MRRHSRENRMRQGLGAYGGEETHTSVARSGGRLDYLGLDVSNGMLRDSPHSSGGNRYRLE